MPPLHERYTALNARGAAAGAASGESVAHDASAAPAPRLTPLPDADVMLLDEDVTTAVAATDPASPKKPTSPRPRDDGNASTQMSEMSDGHVHVHVDVTEGSAARVPRAPAAALPDSHQPSDEWDFGDDGRGADLATADMGTAASDRSPAVSDPDAIAAALAAEVVAAALVAGAVMEGLARVEAETTRAARVVSQVATGAVEMRRPYAMMALGLERPVPFRAQAHAHGGTTLAPPPTDATGEALSEDLGGRSRRISEGEALSEDLGGRSRRISEGEALSEGDRQPQDPGPPSSAPAHAHSGVPPPSPIGAARPVLLPISQPISPEVNGSPRAGLAPQLVSARVSLVASSSASLRVTIHFAGAMAGEAEDADDVRTPERRSLGRRHDAGAAVQPFPAAAMCRPSPAPQLKHDLMPSPSNSSLSQWPFQPPSQSPSQPTSQPPSQPPSRPPSTPPSGQPVSAGGAGSRAARRFIVRSKEDETSGASPYPPSTGMPGLVPVDDAEPIPKADANALRAVYAGLGAADEALANVREQARSLLARAPTVAMPPSVRPQLVLDTCLALRQHLREQNESLRLHNAELCRVIVAAAAASPNGSPAVTASDVRPPTAALSPVPPCMPLCAASMDMLPCGYAGCPSPCESPCAYNSTPCAPPHLGVPMAAALAIPYGTPGAGVCGMGCASASSYSLPAAGNYLPPSSVGSLTTPSTQEPAAGATPLSVGSCGDANAASHSSLPIGLGSGPTAPSWASVVSAGIGRQLQASFAASIATTGPTANTPAGSCTAVGGLAMEEGMGVASNPGLSINVAAAAQSQQDVLSGGGVSPRPAEA